MATSGEQPSLEARFHHRLYLHFFDRELGASVGFVPDESLVRAVTSCLLIASPEQHYCGLSPAWETSFGRPAIAQFLTRLAAGGHIALISNHPTQDEFVAARRAAYEHDPAGHPMYFADAFGVLEGLRPTAGKSASATDALRNELLVWSAVPSPGLLAKIPQKKCSTGSKFLKTVATALERRDHQAITYAMFRPRLGRQQEDPRLEGILRRQISTAYTRHNRTAEGGEMPTGIAGLSLYDSLSHMFPFYDVPLLQRILRAVSVLDVWRPDRADDFLAVRQGDSHYLFADRLRVFVAGLCGETGLPLPAQAGPAERSKLIQAAARLLREVPADGLPARTATEMLFAATVRINTAIRAGRRSPRFGAEATRMEQQVQSSALTPVLLVVATDTEHEAVLAAARERNMGPFDPRYIGDHTYFALGSLGGCDLLLVKCDAGTGGPAGSLVTLTDAMRDVAPDSVIMVGIAFGTKPDKHKMCDVLVSKQVTSYELQRVEEDASGAIRFIPRGDRASAPPRIYDRFWSGSRDWKEAGVHFGLILSGDKLVDSRTFKEHLLSIESEAIGGEMEAAGVYAASLKAHIDWIIVKAIVDWGENKDKKHQQAAAKNAAGLVFHVIAKGGLRR